MAVKQSEANPHDPPPGGWPKPASAYIHVPFCRHRCGYCNFSLVADRDDLIERFLIAIDQELSMLHRPKVKTIFVGGGTPTHLSSNQLDRLLCSMQQRFDLDERCEWSIEANPEDMTAEKVDVLVKHGVNRISLGVQSFDDKKLRTLERSHSGSSAEATVRAVQESISNVSLDLIFAAPNESLAGWRHDLTRALQLPISHLSTYALTFEKGTSYWSRRNRGELVSPDESIEVEMYTLARQLTAEAGLEQYEISNFASKNLQCKHNLSYWDGRGWYAAGPGAARFVDGRREVNHRSTTTYLRRMESGANPTAESETISCQQYARERAAFGVRMIDGINLEQLSQSTGINLRETCEHAIRRSTAEQLLEENGSLIRLTERGILFADTVASRLLDS